MSNFRVMADVNINMSQFDGLVENAPEAVKKSLFEISGEARQIAEDNSRIDTGAMSGVIQYPELNSGWKRSQIGFKGTIKANNENPGYRIYNHTVNKKGETYTHFHEFGTEDFDAQPMAGPAIDYINQMLGQKVLSEVKEAIGKSISGVKLDLKGPLMPPLPKKRRR